MQCTLLLKCTPRSAARGRIRSISKQAILDNDCAGEMEFAAVDNGDDSEDKQVSVGGDTYEICGDGRIIDREACF